MNLYRRIPIRFRIAIGLVGLMTGTIMFACALGFFPNEQEQILAGRSKLCESLAISGTAMVSEGKLDSLRVTLESVVHRDDEVHSIGFRNAGGELLVVTGDHDQHWDPIAPNTVKQMKVPVFRHGEKWGHLEIAFTSTGTLIDKWGPGWLLIFAIPLCILQFSLFLKKTLESLDPDGAMPSNVRNVLNTFAEGLMLVDTSDRILFVNNRLAELVGIDAGDMFGMKSKNLGWLLPEDSRQELPWEEARRLNEFVSDRTVQFRREDKLLTLQVNSTPTMGKGMMATFDDVTLIEENKAKLAVALGAAKDANEAKSAFLANMSHEIRTPLNAVLGFTDVLRRGLVADSNEAVDHLNMIHRSGAHLLELINDILDLSKIEAGRMQVESIDTRVDSVILDTVDVLGVRANEKGIELQTEYMTAVPKIIQADPTRLRQIITNLLGNAIKFTENGFVKVKAEVCEGDQHSLKIHVQDSGIGMTPDQQAKIFDSFVQADSTTTRKFGGTGLGLSISRRLSEAMGGSLTVSSEANVGSTFTVTLPISEQDLDDVVTQEDIQKQAARREAAQQDGSLLRLPNKPVLIVDDGDANRRLISLVLTRAGAQVHEAVNGLEAIKALSERHYDLIFMDMQMPVLDGYSATRRIRSTGCDVPIVALTGNAMKGDREKCIDAGCDDFLSKPVDLDLLLQCSRQYLGDAPVDEVQAPERVQDASVVLGDAFTAPQTPESERDAIVDGDPIHSSLPMDDDDFRHVVADFIERLDSRLDFMEQSCRETDFETVGSEAHWLKGSGGTVGFSEFWQPAADLEQAAKSQDVEQAQSLLREIRSIQSRLVNPLAANDVTAPSFESATQLAEEGDTVESTGEPIHSTLPMDDEEFREIVCDFVQRLDVRLEQMHEMLVANRFEELGNEAHWLKGAGGTVGYGEFMSPSMRLLQAARAENKGDCEVHFAAIREVRGRLVVPDKTMAPQ